MIRCYHLIALIAAASLLILTAHAYDGDVVTIESTSAHYDGDTVILDGDVIIQHPLGKILTNHAAFSGNSTIPFTLVELTDAVTISLDDGTSLRCHNALIDFLKMSGVFSGASPEARIVFTDKSAAAPIVMKSMTMELFLSKDSTLKQYAVKEITADSDVYLAYGDDFMAFSDKAFYRYYDPTDYGDTIGGILILQTREKGNPCHIVDNRGIAIDAAKVRVDTASHAILCSKASGAIDAEKCNGTVTTFSAGAIEWNKKDEIIAFHDNVVIDNALFGRVAADEELYLTRNADGMISSATGNGTTRFSYYGALTGDISTITCHGDYIVDTIQRTMICHSPSSPLTMREQVSITSPLGDVFSDTLVITSIENEEGNLAPQMAKVTGNVKIITEAISANGTKTHTYALADNAEYSLESQVVILRGDKGKRALFFDKSQNLQVSAETVIIYLAHDGVKESISTIGDVRFALNEEEYDMLKQQFNIR